MMRFISFCLFSVLVVLTSCNSSEDTPSDPTVNFSRKELLKHTTNTIVIPSLEEFSKAVVSLETAFEAFLKDKNSTTLQALQQAHYNASVSWQSFAIFEGASGSRFGPSLDTYLRRYINTYPTKTTQIQNAVDTQEYNLNINYVIQGLPALDYLFFSADNDKVLARYTDKVTGAKYTSFTKAIISQMKTKTATVSNKWQTYAATFIANDASGSNGSFSKLLNAITEYYEQQLRKAKLAGPLGKFTQGVVRDQDIEAIYSKKSKALLVAAHKAFVSFYNGVSHDKNITGASLKAYLEATNKKALGTDVLLATKIADKLQATQQKIEAIPTAYQEAVQDKDKALEDAFSAFQEVIALLKVEAFAALDTSIGYNDSDGD